jgi:uncharacterized membrane protein
VLDDVTMSQASLVAELHQANPTAGRAELVAGALRVGWDHIAATVSTLFLAYAGAALPLLILFVTGQDSLGTVATTEVVAVEVVRALSQAVRCAGLARANHFTRWSVLQLVAPFDACS